MEVVLGHNVRSSSGPDVDVGVRLLLLPVFLSCNKSVCIHCEHTYVRETSACERERESVIYITVWKDYVMGLTAVKEYDVSTVIELENICNAYIEQTVGGYD